MSSNMLIGLLYTPEVADMAGESVLVDAKFAQVCSFYS